MKDGWYNSYYSNGDSWEIGTYKDNNRVDEWSHFTEDGEETKGIYTDEPKVNGEFWINVKHDSFDWKETEDDLWEGDKWEDEVFRGLFTCDDLPDLPHGG